MTKTIQDAHNDLDSFYSTPYAALLLIHKGPKGQIEVATNETIKLKELSEENRDIISRFFRSMNATNVEITGYDGVPDRVRVSRDL